MNCFRVLICVILFCIAHCEDSEWRSTTACYGADPACSNYQIQCGPGKRIVIGSLKYGGKRGPERCQLGISNCGEKMTLNGQTLTVSEVCCHYNSTDYLTDFSAENRTSVVENCNGRRKCSGNVPRIFKAAYSSYAWIQYACVEDGSSIEMCRTDSVSGEGIFITFNQSQLNSYPIKSLDCACRVHSLDCSSNLEMNVLDFDPVSSGSLPISPGCRNAYLELGSLTNISCSSPLVNQSSITYVNTWMNTIALRDMLRNGSADKPDIVVVRVRADHTKSPIMVECFEPGVAPTTTVSCPSSSSTFTTSLSSSVTQPSDHPRQTITSKSGLPQSVKFSKPTNSPQPVDISTTTTAVVTTITHISGHTSSSASLSTNVLSSKTTGDLNDKLHTHPIGTVTERTTRVNSTVNELSTSVSSLFSNITSLSTLHGETTQHTTTPPVFLAKTSVSASHATVSSSGTTVGTDASLIPFTLSTVANESETSSEVTVDTSIDEHAQPTSRVISTTEDDDVTFVVAEINPIKGDKWEEFVAFDSRLSVFVTVMSGSRITLLDRCITNSLWNDGTEDETLIIGITIGAVLAILLIVLIVACCCYTRLKRKENVERNYVRNTNIFYSFPEDYTVTENMAYVPLEMTGPNQQLTEIVDLRKPHQENTENESPSPINSTSLSGDEMKTGQRQSYDVNATIPSRMFRADVANGTVEFINGTEPEVIHHDDVHTVMTHGTLGREKSVTFDTFSMYSQVMKDGKTKF